MASERMTQLCVTAQGGKVDEAVIAALNDESVLCFGELWDAVQQVQPPIAADQQPFVELLRIFCFGTYQEYVERKARDRDFPDLSADALLKLRVLTVVSLAARNRELDYASLKQALGVESQRVLEDIVMECMHRDLLRGKFDQKQLRVSVDYVAGRDVSAEDTAHILRVLTEWETSVGAVITSLEQKRNSLLTAQQLKAEEMRRLDESSQQLQKDSKPVLASSKGGARSGGAAPSRFDPSSSQKRGRTAQKTAVSME